MTIIGKTIIIKGKKVKITKKMLDNVAKKHKNRFRYEYKRGKIAVPIGRKGDINYTKVFIVGIKDLMRKRK
jgi:hypothetical protein